MNVKQALAANGRHIAYRMVGDRRIIVEQAGELLFVQIQRQRKKHWISDDSGGSIRYLAGILRDATGRYCCVGRDLVCLEQLRACLPLRDQELCLTTYDDWHPLA